MNVLSLFDGMSCGQLALQKSGIKVDKYFASEIDKYAIKVTMDNFPNTIQLGTVTNVNGYDLPKIDLLIGGSPCQSFSFAGKRAGMSTIDKKEILTLEHYLDLKNQGYEFEGQSYLFWEYVRLLTEVKPKYFLLENVQMSENWEKVISKALGVNPVLIDSALLSAQSRKRLYWTNIGLKPQGLFGYLMPTIELPKDKKIMLKDILENDVDNKYILSEKMTKNMFINSNQNTSIIGHSGSGGQKGVIHNPDFKCSCLISSDAKQQKQIICHNLQRRNPDRPSVQKNKNAGGSGHLSRTDGKSYCLDSSQSNAVEFPAIFDDYNGRLRKDGKSCTLTLNSGSKSVRNGQKIILRNPFIDNEINNEVEIKSGTLRTHHDGKGFREIKTGKGATVPARARQDGSGQNVVQIKLKSKSNRLHQTINENDISVGDIKALDTYNKSIHDKYPTLTLPHNDRALFDGSYIRRLTPVETERLQTVPDNYTAAVSDTQRYKMLGNGWTIDVIKHIFSYLNK